MTSEPPEWLRVSSAPDTGAPAPAPRDSVLFVCTGNICRSAFADASLRHLLGPSSPVRVHSAGISALVGAPMDPLMEAEAHRLGVRETHHAARQLTGRLLGDATVVFVFGPEHVDWIASRHPEHLGKVVGLGHAAAALTARASEARPGADTPPTPAELPALVRKVPTSDRPGLWIPDPYRRGPRAAADAATCIHDAVSTLVARMALRP